MAKYKFLLVFLGVIVSGVASAGPIVLAEFRADRGMLPAGSSRDLASDYDLYHPGNLYSEGVGGSQEQSWSVGKYTLSGVLDWSHRTNYLADRPYSNEQYLSLGSKFRLGDNSETYLYHSYGEDQLGESSDLYGSFGDAQTTRTGLSQSLYFADQQARIGVGYDYASGDREQVYQGLQGHEVNVSGDVHIGWGFSAHLEAGYGLYSYKEYEGVQGNLSSARTNMRAGISRSFSPNFSWGLHYSYVDEQFDLPDLSQSRHTWGLDLEYRY